MSADRPAPESSTAPGKGPDAIRFSKRVLVAAVVLLLICCACLYSPMALEQLLLGWIYFPIRVLPQVTVDWPSAVIGTVSALLMFLAIHLLIRRLARPAAAQASARTYLRSSIACTLGPFLLFASGTAMVGAAHQVIWLAAGRPTPAEERGASVPGFIAQARATARATQQRNSLKQIGLGISNFADVYEVLPPGGTIDERGRLMHGWVIYLGPYMWFMNDNVDFSMPWNAPPNDRLYKCALSEFINPAIPEVFDREGYGLSHVAANVHVFPIVTVPRKSPSSASDATYALCGKDAPPRNDRRLRSSDLRRGAANLMLVGESAGNFKPWGYPANVRDPTIGIGKSLDGFGGPPGAGGAQVLMADGSVRFLSNETGAAVLEALARPMVNPVDSDSDVIRR